MVDKDRENMGRSSHIEFHSMHSCNASNEKNGSQNLSGKALLDKNVNAAK